VLDQRACCDCRQGGPRASGISSKVSFGSSRVSWIMARIIRQECHWNIYWQSVPVHIDRLSMSTLSIMTFLRIRAQRVTTLRATLTGDSEAW